MQVFILLCLVASAFAVRECPENSRYNSCGTACPLTCENYQNPPKVCVLMCNPGCHCNEGYVKTKDGRCVLPEDCDKPVDAVCGPNQEYRECGTACPLTCDNYDNPPKICPAMCVSGCHCQKGYVKTAEGRCVLPENCPSRAFEKSSCLLPADGGMCRGYFPMFHYDAKTGDCKEFIYGGCQGNDNIFGTEEECLEKCSDVKVWESSSNVCEQPIERGMCLAYMPRYGFDKTTGQCKKFIYGGCQGNGNNFQSLEECESACGAPQGALDRPDCDKGAEPGLCKAYMPRYYYDQEAGMCKKFIYGGCGGNRNNFATEFECYNKCGALAAPSACQMEKEIGPCRAAFPRYYFNKASGQCEKFIYGGCHGNSNNFETQEECESVCTA